MRVLRRGAPLLMIKIKWKTIRKWRFLSTTYPSSHRKCSRYLVRKVFRFDDDNFSNKNFRQDPIAAKATNDSSGDRDNTYFVSFLLRDRKNRSMSDADSNLKRMVVNNNFSGEKMGTSQVYVESGPPPKQAPAHNIQLLNNNGGPPQGFPPSPYPKPYPQQQQPQPPMQSMTYG